MANHSENNMNTWGVSNFCATVDHKVAASVGEEKLRAFAAMPERRRDRCKCGANTAISTLNLLFDKRTGDARPRIQFLPPTRVRSWKFWIETRVSSRNAANDHPRPTTTPPEFAVLNLRDPSRPRLLAAKMESRPRRDRVGSDFSWTARSTFRAQQVPLRSKYVVRIMFNATPDQTIPAGILPGLSVEPAAQSFPSIALIFERHGRNAAPGYTSTEMRISESSASTGTDRRPARELDNLFLWSDCLASLDAPAIRRSGHDPDDVYFRGLALSNGLGTVLGRFRDVLTFLVMEGSWCAKTSRTPAISILLRAYNQVEPFMRRARDPPRS